MSAVTDVGRNFWLHGLPNVSKTLDGGIQQWILDSDYSIDAGPQKKLFTVRSNTTGSVQQSFAFDIARQSCAAFETAQSIKIQTNFPLSSGWVVIQSYYSAYFAANALMRCFGYACSNLNLEHTTSIKNMSGLFGFPVTGNKLLQPGVYLFEFNAGKSELHARSLQSIGGGVHGQFWFGFLVFTHALIKKIEASALPKKDKQDAMREIQQLQGLLSSANSVNGNWLSLMRNSVNYRLEYGGWYPYNEDSLNADLIQKEFNGSWKNTPDFNRSKFSGSDIVKFTFTCGLLVAWCRESVKDIAQYSTHRSHFIQKNTIAYLKEINL